VTATVTHLPGVALRPGFDDVGAEIRQLRAEARARVSEVDLLVAALQDHIKDLRAERDWLRAELEHSRARQELAEAAWLHRGLKGSH
jgi:hypothetical protein